VVKGGSRRSFSSVERWWGDRAEAVRTRFTRFDDLADDASGNER
jgi:hypothetical protein